MVFVVFVLCRINFFRSAANMIDLLATATFYVDLILSLLNKVNDLSEMINLIQVARLFRLTRHSPGLKVGAFVFFTVFLCAKSTYTCWPVEA